MTSLPPFWNYDVKSKNPTPSIDVHLREEHSFQISFQSDLKRRSLGLFGSRWRAVAPTRIKNKMSSDMRSVQDLKMRLVRNILLPICNLLFLKFSEIFEVAASKQQLLQLHNCEFVQVTLKKKSLDNAESVSLFITETNRPFTASQLHKAMRSTCSSTTANHLLSVPQSTTFHSVLVLFTISSQNMEFLNYLLTVCSLKHSLHLDVI